MRRLAQVLLASMLLAGLWAPTASAQSPGGLPPELAGGFAESKRVGDTAAADARRKAETQDKDGSAPRTLFVDKDRVQCRQAEFQSIQEAVAVAPPESTIMVCPDLYTEDVVVDKPLTLKEHGGGNGDVDERPDCFRPEPPDPTRDAIVQGGTYSFFLLGGATLDGFVVQGSFFGIYTFGGSEIRDTLVQDNVVGTFISFAGGVDARNNCFRQNSFAGLAADFSSSLRIEENSFFQNADAGALLSVGADVRFEHNVSREDGNFFVVVGGMNQSPISGPPSSVSHNDSVGSGAQAAIETFGSYAGGNLGLAITHNRLRQARDGIFLGGGDGQLDVAFNDLREMRRDGMRADGGGVYDSRIAYNLSTDNGQDGLHFQPFGTHGNRIEHNDARRNASDGIHAQGATGNVFLKNIMFDNLEFDARDDARPDNRWIDNQCRTDFPTGTICGFSDPAP